MPSAYVVETAGPAIDVAGKYEGKQLVTLSGAKTYASSTKLFMTTVSSYGTADNGVPSAQVFASLFARDMQAVPVRALYSENETSSDVDKKNAALMTDSQDNAAVVALGKTGHTVAMKLVVAGVPKSSRASGKLAKGDVLTSISAAGQKTEIRTYSDLVQRLAKIAPGTTVTVGFARDGKEKTAEIVTAGHEADATGWTHPGSKLGVYLSAAPVLPVDITVNIDGVGGPSAGMMFSLSIIDRLTPGDMTGGNVIAGTGTMSYDGQVGAIGGIQQKLWGAHRDGAQWFLAPSNNCDEVVGHVPDGLRVVSVSTLDEAVSAVRSIADGTGDALPTCQ